MSDATENAKELVQAFEVAQSDMTEAWCDDSSPADERRLIAEKIASRNALLEYIAELEKRAEIGGERSWALSLILGHISDGEMERIAKSIDIPESLRLEATVLGFAPDIAERDAQAAAAISGESRK